MRRGSFPQAPAQVDASCDFTDVLFNRETICRKLVWIWRFSPLLHPQAQCPPLQRRVSPFWLLSFNPHWVTGARLCSEMTPCSTSPVIFPNTSVRTYWFFLYYSCISWLETMISEIQKAKSSVLLSTFFLLNSVLFVKSFHHFALWVGWVYYPSFCGELDIVNHNSSLFSSWCVYLASGRVNSLWTNKDHIVTRICSYCHHLTWAVYSSVSEPVSQS